MYILHIHVGLFNSMFQIGRNYFSHISNLSIYLICINVCLTHMYELKEIK